MTSYAESVLSHYRKIWGTDLEKIPFNQGPIGDLPADFSVAICAPHASRNLWTYATIYMSQLADPEPIELHLFSRSRVDQLAELLVAMAHYHRTASTLGLNHTVNFGRPWLPNSNCNHGLISLPYLDGPKLEWSEIEQRSVRFLWLIPITVEELNYKKNEGVQALEAQFDEVHFDYADPTRRSVV